MPEWKRAIVDLDDCEEKEAKGILSGICLKKLYMRSARAEGSTIAASTMLEDQMDVTVEGTLELCWLVELVGSSNWVTVNSATLPS